jgi:hypothetical protein
MRRKVRKGAEKGNNQLPPDIFGFLRRATKVLVCWNGKIEVVSGVVCELSCGLGVMRSGKSLESGKELWRWREL